MGWNSPWKGKGTGGELISEGEDELYHLGIRVREQFPSLFSEEYHPAIYSIKATQVDRSVILLLKICILTYCQACIIHLTFSVCGLGGGVGGGGTQIF